MFRLIGALVSLVFFATSFGPIIYGLCVHNFDVELLLTPSVELEVAEEPEVKLVVRLEWGITVSDVDAGNGRLTVAAPASYSVEPAFFISLATTVLSVAARFYRSARG